MKFLQSITALRFKRSKKFALIGAESYLKELFINTAKVVYPEEDMVKIFPDNQEEGYDILSSQGLFSDGLLVMNAFDKMKTSVFEEVTADYSGCLIMAFTEGANIRTRSMTKILTDTVIVECKKLREYGNDYPTWIKSQITDSGYESEPDVENLIFAKIGPSMFTLANELKKLFLLKEKGEKITLDEVKRHVSVTSSSTAFEIFENLMKRDVLRALVGFNSYTRNRTSFTDMVGFLGTYLEKMYRMLLLKEYKYDIADISDIIGIPKFLVQTKYMPKALAFGKHGISAKINALCNLDVQLRLFRGDKRILFEKFILEFKK